MKVNLFLGKKDLVRSGYLNLDASLSARPADPADDRRPCSVNDWPGVSPNEATEIVATLVLDLLPPHHVGEVFGYWVSRLALGGKLVVICGDCVEVAHQLSLSDRPVETCNKLLYNGRQSAHTVESLAELFEQAGLKVTWKMLNGMLAVVEGVRPNE